MGIAERAPRMSTHAPTPSFHCTRSALSLIAELVYDAPASRFAASFIGHSNLLNGAVHANAEGAWLNRGAETLRLPGMPASSAADITLMVRPENARLVSPDQLRVLHIILRRHFPLDCERPAGFQDALLHLVHIVESLPMQYRQKLGMRKEFPREVLLQHLAALNQSRRFPFDNLVEPAVFEQEPDHQVICR